MHKGLTNSYGKFGDEKIFRLEVTSPQFRGGGGKQPPSMSMLDPSESQNFPTQLSLLNEEKLEQRRKKAQV